MLFYYGLSLFGSHLYVGDLFLSCLVDFYDGLVLAKTNAACLRNCNLVVKAGAVNLFNESVKNRSCACSDTAGSHTYNNSDVVRTFAKNNLVSHFVFDCLQFSQRFHFCVLSLFAFLFNFI